MKVYSVELFHRLWFFLAIATAFIILLSVINSLRFHQVIWDVTKKKSANNVAMNTYDQRLRQQNYWTLPDTNVQYIKLSENRIWDISSLDDQFESKPLCFSSSSNISVGGRTARDLLILVTSSPANFLERQFIRESWGRNSMSIRFDGTGFSWKTIFLVGQASTDALSFLVNEEASREQDVLLGFYEDTYRNLTLKVIHGLWHAARNCRANYILKTDDDCFVNVPLLLEFLRKYNCHQQKLYVGNIRYKAFVIRSVDNKWHVSEKLFPNKMYPPYARGIGYVISVDLLEPLLNASERLLPFPNEDAYVGVLMSHLLVQPVNSYRFSLYSHSLHPCNYLYLMVIHKVIGTKQRKLMDSAQKANSRCPIQNLITTWN